MEEIEQKKYSNILARIYLRFLEKQNKGLIPYIVNRS